jgi:predicted DNA-binding protein
MNKKTQILGVRLTEETKNKLFLKAEKDGISASNIARIIIEKELKNVK